MTKYEQFKKYIRDHKKQILLAVGVTVGVGTAIVLVRRGILNKKTVGMIATTATQPPIANTLVSASEVAVQPTRGYVWKEAGHMVSEHYRHYADGSKRLIRSYYKPTGRSLVA